MQYIRLFTTFSQATEVGETQSLVPATVGFVPSDGAIIVNVLFGYFIKISGRSLSNLFLNRLSKTAVDFREASVSVEFPSRDLSYTRRLAEHCLK